MKRWMLMVLSIALVVIATAFVLEPPRYAAADGESPGYVGVPECKACHFKQFKSYGKSTLAQAFEHLKPDQAVEAKKAAGLDPAKDYTTDPKCLKCHTTAYGQPGGYPTIVEGAELTEEQTACATKNAAVTCEACHGPGSLYIPFKKENKEYARADIVKLGALAPVTAANCADCHKKECPTMPDDYTFDFEKEKANEKVHDHKALKKEH